MTNFSSHSHHSSNSTQDLFDSSLNRFLDEPGHLSALEIIMVLDDSAYSNDDRRLQSSNGALLLCQEESHLLHVATSSSSSSCENPEQSAPGLNLALKGDLEEIEKLKEMKLQLERDLKAKKERKKRRAQKKKKRRSALRNESNEEESPEHDVSVLKSKEQSEPKNSPKKVKDELKNREKVERDRNKKTSPRISKKESQKELSMQQSREGSGQEQSHGKTKQESLTLRELYSDTGSLLLEGYIQVKGNRRRHSSHERTSPFPEFTASDLMETDQEKESGSKRSVVDPLSPRQEKRRHSACDITRKAPARCTSCPIQEITIVKMSKKDASKMEVSLTKQRETKTKSKDEEGNNKHSSRKVKQVKNEKGKQESSPKAAKIKEITTTEVELNALKERQTPAAPATSKKDRLKIFEEERGSSASPRIRSRKKPGLSNKPPPKCVLDALNWATRSGLFGVNYDQTRRARMIAAHRREKFDELVGEYDRGVILRRHSVSS